MLGKMMQGQPVVPKTYPIAPIGVATRLSTDLVAASDPRIAEAMRFIRAQALNGIGVADVLQHVPMSRTLLERKFQQYFDRSPYECIRQIRDRHAEELLLKTDLSITEIAEQAGFLTAEYFSATFSKRTGLSPRAFRGRARRGG